MSNVMRPLKEEWIRQPTFQHPHEEWASIQCGSGPGGAGTVSDQLATECTEGVTPHRPWGWPPGQEGHFDKLKCPGRNYPHKHRKGWRLASQRGTPRPPWLELERGFRIQLNSKERGKIIGGREGSWSNRTLAKTRLSQRSMASLSLFESEVESKEMNHTVRFFRRGGPFHFWFSARSCQCLRNKAIRAVRNFRAVRSGFIGQFQTCRL